VPADHLLQAAKARGGALLLDQKDRVNRARRIAERDNQLERRLARQPLVRRAILKQHHAGQRPARPLLAVRRAARRDRHQPAAPQHGLCPSVAERQPVCGLQCFVRMLDREVPAAGPILLHHKLDPVDRCPPPRTALASAIDQPLGPVEVRFAALRSSLRHRQGEQWIEEDLRHQRPRARLTASSGAARIIGSLVPVRASGERPQFPLSVILKRRIFLTLTTATGESRLDNWGDNSLGSG
jgi:hypothetical protein